jgi:hypothetical protein
MSEDTFKPQRTPIDPSELKAEPAPEAAEPAPEAPAPEAPAPEASAPEAISPQEQMEQMEHMRANAAAEGEMESLQVSGNPPPQFQQVLAQMKQQKEPAPERAAPGESRRMQTRKPTRQKNPLQQPSDMRVTGSERLEELIRGIEDQAIYEPVELPSRGVFYDGTDGPPDGVLHIRPMTGEEEQILATPRFVRKGQAINMIFNRCVQEKYDTERFLDLNGLYVDYCPADFNDGNLTDVLPTTGYQFTYRLARGGDEQEVQNYRDHRAKNFDLSSQADDTLLYRTSLLIDNIEGLQSRNEIQMLMRKLPISDVAYMRDATSNPPFGVNTTVTIQSPYTLQDFEIELPLEANFFFPRAKKGIKNTQ